MIAFIFLCLLSSSKIAENDKMRVYQFGSFRGNQNIYFENQDNIRAKVIQNANPNEKSWHYVYTETNDDDERKQIFEENKIYLSSENVITKNLYVLYLNSNEVRNLLTYDPIYIHELTSEDKIHFDLKYSELNSERKINSNNEKEYIIKVAKDYELPINEDKYHIQSKFFDCFYKIEINDAPENVLDYISSFKGVMSIHQYVKPQLMNRFISGFTQRNEASIDLENLIIPRYINDHGITGKDENIIVIDTPIDVYHPMFYDPDHEFKINQLNLEHRKVIYYSYNDSEILYSENITESEHGTHVAGTIAGQNICEDHSNDGNAPDAKLIYGTFKDLQSELTALSFSNISGISSNSWGTSYQYIYNSFINDLAYSIGAYDLKSTLFIFAAGNDGEKRPFMTLGSPGSSKNILTVGSLDPIFSSTNNYILKAHNETFQYNLISMHNGEISYFEGFLGEQIQIVNETEDNEICTKINNTDVIYIFYRNDNNLNLFISDFANCYDKNHNITLNVDFFFTLDNSISILNNEKVSIEFLYDLNKTKVYSKASYSSSGPSFTGIIKPDVMFPGSKILSANSHSHSNTFHSCEINNEYIFMDGTSMATPSCAGAAALIRQYFREGYWNSQNKTLSSIELRGLLITSASNEQLSKDIINSYSGFGVCDLSKILKFEDNNYGIIISEPKSSIIYANGHKTSRIRINKKKSNEDLIFVMTYLDQVPNVDSMITIFNDLDLVVESPSGKIFIGNHNEYNGGISIEGIDSSHISTNEKIIIKSNDVEDGEYTIHIYCDSPMEDVNGTEFSVIAKGPILDEEIDFEDSNSCYCLNNEFKCQAKHPGRCQCDDNHVGHSCQIKIEQIEPKDINLTLNRHSILRFRIANVSQRYNLTIIRPSQEESIFSRILFDSQCYSNLAEYSNNLNLEEITTTVEIYANTSTCFALFNNSPISQTFQILYIGENTDPDETTDGNSKKSRLNLILGVTIPIAIVIIILIIVLGVCIHRRKKASNLEHNEYSTASVLEESVF